MCQSPRINTQTTPFGPFLLFAYFRASEMKAWETCTAQEQKEKHAAKKGESFVLSLGLDSTETGNGAVTRRKRADAADKAGKWLQEFKQIQAERAEGRGGAPPPKKPKLKVLQEIHRTEF